MSEKNGKSKETDNRIKWTSIEIIRRCHFDDNICIYNLYLSVMFFYVSVLPPQFWLASLNSKEQVESAEESFPYSWDSTFPHSHIFLYIKMCLNLASWMKWCACIIAYGHCNPNLEAWMFLKCIYIGIDLLSTAGF